MNPVQKVLPGLSLQKILSDVGKEVKEMGKQGAHELAAALFSGNQAFVMYPRASREQQAERQQERGIER